MEDQSTTACFMLNKPDTDETNLSEDSNINLFVSEIRHLIENNDHYRAEQKILDEFKANGFSSACMNRIAGIYELQNNYNKACTLARRILTVYPGEPELVYQLSFALYKLDSLEEALEHLIVLNVQDPSPRVFRLSGLILRRLGQLSDAIDMLTKAVENDPLDIISSLMLCEIYADLGFNSRALDIVHAISEKQTNNEIKILESVIYRSMGEPEHAKDLLLLMIEEDSTSTDAYWVLSFNYSISSAEYSFALLKSSQQFWKLLSSNQCTDTELDLTSVTIANRQKTRLGFLSADIGDHVVSRFLAPIIRSYDRQKYHIIIICVARRFEESATEIASYADEAISLQGKELADAIKILQSLDLDIVVDTSGFTRNSGLPLLASRCARVQCHYIGYHATTGLDTIDYFLGDGITTPVEFQNQYTERLVQIPSLWMAYDYHLEFPNAVSTAKRASPVLGSFSQVAKISTDSLAYWAAAMRACPDSVLVIKDRGLNCKVTCERIESSLEKLGVNPQRIYLFGPVSTQMEHLGCYNAIDIALDTTPWSGATTAFEALGMGVPLVAICGDSTSGRMSTSVVHAAKMSHLISHSIDEFASNVAELGQQFQKIRGHKDLMQKEIRSGILFDELRICRDFFRTIDRLLSVSSDDS